MKNLAPYCGVHEKTFKKNAKKGALWVMLVHGQAIPCVVQEPAGLRQGEKGV